METVAVGFFDGVHLGHQAILRRADSALTFRDHPLSLLAPERAPSLLMSVDERVAAIRVCGVRTVEVLEFTREIAALPPEEFARRYFTGKLVLCGENWRFGRGGAGDTDTLRGLGISSEVVPYAVYNGGQISSSRIRESLSRGEIEDVAAMLGRAFVVRGEIVRGKGVGSRIGFPTVNVRLDRPQIFPLGVYVVEVGGVRAMANFGRAPTMGEAAWETPIMEIHFPARRISMGGGNVSVALIRFIRPERTFASIDELKAQIASDCKLADLI